MTVKTCENFDKKDRINSVNNTPMKEVVGKTITVVGCALCTDINKDGEEMELMYLKAEDGTIYGTISSTCIRSYNDIEDYLADEGKIAVAVNSRKANSGREFIFLHIE